MKSALFIMIFFFTGFGLTADLETFYFYNNQPVRLQLQTDQLAVRFSESMDQADYDPELRRLIGSGFRESGPMLKQDSRLVRLTDRLTESEMAAIITYLNDQVEIKLAAPVFKNGKVHTAVTDEFIARFPASMKRSEIEAFNISQNVVLVTELPENTWVLQALKNSGLNGLTAANHYYQSGFAEWANPNFNYMDWELLNAEVNDPLWEQQWAHRNTGQPVASGAADGFSQQVNGYADADMDVDEAWDVLAQNGGAAGGSADVLLAIIDSGIDHEHPDLDDQFYSFGSDFSGDGTTDDFQGHGTNVAGIIAAEGNNGTGVAGIAYNSQLLPVKFYSVMGGASDAQLAQAVDSAWQQGSDILVNSWGGNAMNQALDDAIHRAKTQGRSGLGCVIFYSSGNEGRGVVNYPGYLDDVIAVGASNMYDEKKHTGSLENNFKWAPNFGDALDLVAPTTVYTTDIVGSGGWASGDYLAHFGGTSASCPNAAGVAALVLAANSNLTSDEVQTILQNSADKIDKYLYNANGWNKHVGYGRVNAKNAVMMALGYDGEMPLIQHEMVQPTSSINERPISAEITDNAGIAGGENAPRLWYRSILPGDTSQWASVTDTDGPSGSIYTFLVPGFKWSTQVQYFFAAQDNSPESNRTTLPFGGIGTSPGTVTPPGHVFNYYTGDFATQSYASTDVPVSWTRQYRDHSSTLTIQDDLSIVDINATLDVSGDDFLLNLESPQTRAVGLSGIQGGKAQTYSFSNTTFDDEAATSVSDGTAPFSGSYQADNGLFLMDGVQSQGEWTLRFYQDPETAYGGTDGGTISNWNLNVTYAKPNYPPVVTGIPDPTINEGQNFNTFDLDNYVTDPDDGVNELSWTYSGNQDLSVNINANHVVSITIPNPDWFGAETITFTATDPGGWSGSDSVLFTVLNVNDAPVVTPIQNQTIEEGGAFAAITLDNFVSDIDHAVTEMVWSYSGNTDLTVSINQYRMATVSAPNPDWFGAETITFRATDPGGLFDETAATFTITAVNDAPVISGIPNYTINEGQSFNPVNLDDFVSDVDNADAELLWNYSGNSDLNITINENRIASIAAPDENWNGSEAIIFIVTDPGGLSDRDTVLFTVNPVNDAPSVTGIPDQTVPEGQSFNALTLDNYVVDIDNADADLVWTFSGNTALSIVINEHRIATISAIDENWNGAETIIFTATDPGGLSDRDTVKFTVTPVNDPPVAAGIPNQTINEGGTFTPITLDNYVSDVDNAITEMSWSYSGNANLLISIENRVATIATPSEIWNGSETVIFTATDPGGLSDSDTVTFVVIPVNGNPVISEIPDQNTNEGTPFNPIILDNFVFDTDNTVSQMVWTYRGNSALSVSINASRIASVSAPNQNWHGAETIIFTVTDPGGLSDQDTVLFTVHPVNDAPVVSAIPDQTINEGQQFSPIVLDNYVVDVDNADAEISWAYRGNSELTVAISVSRIATVTVPSSIWNGTEFIVFEATDPGGLSGRDTVKFTVQPVNGTPVISKIPDQIIGEGATFAPIALDDYISDSDNTDEEMEWTFSGNIDLLINIDADRVATIDVPDPEWNGQEDVIFTAMDPGGLLARDTVRFGVTGENDPPEIISDLPQLSFNEDDSLVYPNSNWYPYVEDPDDPDSTLRYTISDDGRTVTATENANSHTLKAPENWFGRDTLLFIVWDEINWNLGLFEVLVRPVNDPPWIEGLPDSIVFDNDKTYTLNLASYEQDIDSPADARNWILAAADTALKISHSPGTKTAELSAPGFSGNTRLFLTLTDDSLATDTASVPVRVKNTTAIELAASVNLPEIFTLSQNFPNPFNPETTIRFALPEACRVDLSVYNLLGKKLATLVHGFKPAGEYRVILNAADFGGMASGIYLYKLSTESGFVQVKKLVLLK